MFDKINVKLEKIEETYGVKILFACEAGSRLWGMSSKDSDYDIRFLYILPYHAYLSIDPVGHGKSRDVIDSIDDPFDCSGWEITKALRLFRKSNPSLLESLQASIIYREQYETLKKMKQMAPSIFQPKACVYHYLHMAINNFKILKRETNSQAKAYLHLLRPILLAKWILENNEFPPVNIPILIEEMIQNEELKMKFQQLLQAKIENRPIDLDVDYMMACFKQEIEEIKLVAEKLESQNKKYTDQLNQLFQQTLLDAWGPYI